jgi:hypothetical protein
MERLFSFEREQRQRRSATAALAGWTDHFIGHLP